MMAKVVVAWTTPFVAKSVPLKVPIPKLVVVALVKSAFVATREEAKSEVVVAFVPWMVVEKKRLEVALVAFRLRVSSHPVVVAFVAVRLPEMRALPSTAKRAPGVFVATPMLLLERIERAETVEVAKVAGDEVEK